MAGEQPLGGWICIILNSSSPDENAVAAEIEAIFGETLEDFFITNFGDDSEEGAHAYVKCSDYAKARPLLSRSRVLSYVCPSTISPYFMSDGDILGFRESFEKSRGNIGYGDIVVVDDESSVFSNLYGIVSGECDENGFVPVLFRLLTRSVSEKIDKKHLSKCGNVSIFIP